MKASVDTFRPREKREGPQVLLKERDGERLKLGNERARSFAESSERRKA